MALIDEDRYRFLTHDKESYFDDVEQALEDSQRALEEWLERPLAQQEITEHLTMYSGVVYPSVTPIISTSAGTIQGNSIIGVTADPTDSFNFLAWVPYTDWANQVQVTYIGGFTEATLPMHLQRAIAEGAQTILTTSTSSSVPAGATSVRLGDAAITYNPNEARTSVAGGLFSKGSLTAISRWKRKYV